MRHQPAVEGRTIHPPGAKDWPAPWKGGRDERDFAEGSIERAHWDLPENVVSARRAEALADWRLEGACSGADVNDMFPEGARQQREIAQFCILACPVREACLSYALEADERWGVWGGTTEAERAKLRKVMREEGVPPEEVAALVAAEQEHRHSLKDLSSGRTPRAPDFELIPTDDGTCHVAGCGNLGHKQRAGRRADVCQRHMRERAAG